MVLQKQERPACASICSDMVRGFVMCNRWQIAPFPHKKSTSSRPPATPDLSPGTAPDLGSCCASYFDGARMVEKKAERRCHTPASWLLCSLSPPRASDAPFPAMHCTNMRILVNTHALDCPRTFTPAPSLLGPVLCCSLLSLSSCPLLYPSYCPNLSSAFSLFSALFWAIVSLISADMESV